MGIYRCKLEIIADILNVTNKSAKKTQIMFQANLSHKVLQKYLDETIGASLISFDAEENLFELTTKGQEFLDAYKKYSITNKQMEKSLNNHNTMKKTLEEMCSKQ